MAFLEDTVELFELGIASGTDFSGYIDLKAEYFAEYNDWIDSLISSNSGSGAALGNISEGVLAALAQMTGAELQNLYDEFSNHILIPALNVSEEPYPNPEPFRMVKRT